ncbi:MAG: hypothetical protein K0M39_02365 [Rhizobium sp.]|nr:hypothetical protein [Rhizobium sp.]
MTNTIKVSRIELYEAVWSEPMTKLAGKYGVSDVALGKICRKHNIPLPGAGHWAKVAAGKKFSRPPLPDDAASEISISPPEKGKAEQAQNRLALAHQLAEVPAELPVPQTISKPHRLTVLTKEFLKSRKPEMYGLVSCWPPRGYALAVSPHQVGRALRILDTLVKAFERAGFEIVVDEKERELQVVILGEAIPFRMREASAQIPIPPEKREKGIFSRAYDYQPKGVLSIQLPKYLDQVKSSWSDGKKPLEENLATVFEGILVAAVRYKERSEELAAWKADFREKERIRAEEKAALEHERKTLDALVQEAQRWTMSQQVLDYVTHIETILGASGSKIPSAALNWIADSRKRAEQMDPTENRLGAIQKG